MPISVAVITLVIEPRWNGSSCVTAMFVPYFRTPTADAATTLSSDHDRRPQIRQIVPAANLLEAIAQPLRVLDRLGAGRLSRLPACLALRDWPSLGRARPSEHMQAISIRLTVRIIFSLPNRHFGPLNFTAFAWSWGTVPGPEDGAVVIEATSLVLRITNESFQTRGPPDHGARNIRWTRVPGPTCTMERSGVLLAPPLLRVIELAPLLSMRETVEWSAPT